MASGSAPEYVLGSSEEEHRRLIFQAQLFRPITERAFREAGLRPGMRVLDVGCGAGDVAFLAAEMVGPGGSVLGIDRDPNVIGFAERRAAHLGISNVRFAAASIDDTEFAERFDAVVGRFVLLYQVDPAATLRRCVSFVRPGGCVVFQEMDMTSEARCWPPVPLFQQCLKWIVETFQRGGCHVDMGIRLYRTFADAGLPAQGLIAETPVGGGEGSPICALVANVVRSLLPRMQQLGVATAEEVQIETLRDRLERETVANRSQVTAPMQFGAWATVP